MIVPIKKINITVQFVFCCIDKHLREWYNGCLEAFVRKTMHMLKYTILEDNKVEDKIGFGNL